VQYAVNWFTGREAPSNGYAAKEASAPTSELSSGL
jgi:hypothetical protein